MTAAVSIRRIADPTEDDVRALAGVLIDCVEGGASVGFMLPITVERASEFWRGVAADVAAGRRLLLVAEDDDGCLGTVQIVLAGPENQPHRADLAKMLVHRRARRRGVGAALVEAAEALARGAGRTLLVLDTASEEAERVYRRLGWHLVGEIPDFALWPGGGLVSTRFYYRRLG